ncbi:MAG: phospholipase D-like domain-containing protein, partial [Elusimicrobiota bacterium]
FVVESRKIADALERALKRGLKVRVVGDKSQSQSDHVQLFLGWLQRRGAQVRILGGPNGEESNYPLAEKMHNKYFIFDGRLVETGSANATKNAGVNNFENANFIDDKTDVAAFAKTYQHMFDIAETAPAYPEGELPTDAQLRENALQPRGPPAPPAPGHGPLPAARRVAFNGVDFPASAIRPNEPVETEIIKAIDSAVKTLRIAIYELNHLGIWDALQRAKKRGVKIQIVLDRSHVYTTGYEDDGVTPRKPKPMIVSLIKEGFGVLLLKGRLVGIMHNKFFVVDEGLAQFGSYNYTQQSEDDHYENVFFSIDKARVNGYLKYFEYMRGLAEEPDMGKLDEAINRIDAVLPAADNIEPSMAEQLKPPPPDPPQETDTPISLNGAMFPIHMFSPNVGIEKTLIRAIEASLISIDIAMFSFFSRPIAEALLRAKDRGVKVRVGLDRSQAGTSKLDEWFAWHGFDLRVLRGPDDARAPRYQKMPHKFA